MTVMPSPALVPATGRYRFTLSAINVRRLLVAIVLLAVLLRVGSALFQGNQIDTLPGIYDQVSYDGLARRVLEGHGFSFGEDHWPATRAGEPTAHWSFLYTLYLTGVYALFGPDPLPARLIQAVFAGVVQTILMWRLGKRLFNPTAGLLAAAFGAVYIYFVYYAGALITETFYITALLWILDIALRIDERARSGESRNARSWHYWLIWGELGLAIGVAALLRQLVLLLVPLLFLWLWWRIARRRPGEAAGGRAGRWFGWRTLAGFAVSIAIVVLMILPMDHAQLPRLPHDRTAQYQLRLRILLGRSPDLRHAVCRHSPGRRDRVWRSAAQGTAAAQRGRNGQGPFGRGLGFVLDDPARYALLSLSRTREYFKFWPSADSSTISNISRVGSFGLFLPFMLYGAILAAVRSVRSRNEAWGAHMLLFLGFIVLYTLMHLLTWTLIRYRLPVDAFLLLFAAYGVDDLLQRVGLGINTEYIVNANV